MLRRVTITGFKSIVSADLELGRINVFVGSNGAGKSVVLEAIGVLGAAADGRVDDASLLRRGVRPGVPALYKNAFAEDNIPRLITLHARSDDATPVVYDVSLDNPIQQAGTMPWRFTHERLGIEVPRSRRKSLGRQRNFVSRGPRGAKLWGPKGKTQSFKPADATRGIVDTPNPLGELPEYVRNFLNVLRQYAIYDPQTPVLRGIVSEDAPLDPVGIGGGRLPEALREVMNSDNRQLVMHTFFKLIGWAKAIGSGNASPRIVTPSVSQPRLVVRFRDKFMREGRNTLSAYDASEGALYVLMSLVLLAHPRAPKTLAIENVDHALHPRLARHLVQALSDATRDSGKQLLLTTHNPLVLDGLELQDDEVRLFTADRDKRGHTIIRRIEYSEALRHALESGLTLSQIWTRGLIGAVPNIL